MNDGRECRICMIGDDEEELIQPCRCTTAYVHESCLQKWREENIDNERYNQCEICKADYLIRREFPKETFELEKTCSAFFPSFCIYIGYLLLGSLIIGFTDTITDVYSVTIMNHGYQDNKFINDLDSGDSFTWCLYYANYTSYLMCMIFSVYVTIGILMKVHRKREYFKETLGKYVFYFLLSWNYFYNYLIFYKGMKRFDIYTIATAISCAINYMSIKNVLSLHNNTIKKLNTDNMESIISVRYNQLIDITAIDDMV